MALLKALWNGDISLVKAYWIFGLGIHMVLRMPELYFGAFYPESLTIPAINTVIWTTFVIYLIYGPFSYICIWRSANKYQGPKVYSVLAKVVLFYAWIAYVSCVAYTLAPSE